MPELPEVETVARTLDPLLRGRTITSFELRWPRTLESPTHGVFEQAIIGASIARVGRRAKLVVIFLDDSAAITIHLRMTGELLFRQGGAVERPAVREPYLRAIFGFSGNAELLFYDTRKFGRIAYWPARSLAELDQRFGIEPLSDAFSSDVLDRLLQSRNRRIKPLLLDQSIISGLGNIYVDEALFRAGIHPMELSRHVPQERVHALHQAIRDILTAAISARGTTLRDYRSGLGEPGSNQQLLRVYGMKPGTPCTICGTPLERLVVAQRGSMFCPRCQPLRTVTRTRGQ